MYNKLVFIRSFLFLLVIFMTACTLSNQEDLNHLDKENIVSEVFYNFIFNKVVHNFNSDDLIEDNPEVDFSKRQFYDSSFNCFPNMDEYYRNLYYYNDFTVNTCHFFYFNYLSYGEFKELIEGRQSNMSKTTLDRIHSYLGKQVEVKTSTVNLEMIPNNLEYWIKDVELCDPKLESCGCPHQGRKMYRTTQLLFNSEFTRVVFAISTDKFLTYFYVYYLEKINKKWYVNFVESYLGK